MEFTPVQTTPFPFRIKIKGKIWSLVNKTIYKYSPSFFRKYRIGLVKIFGGNIDWSCSLHRLSTIDHPWNLKMDAQSSLGEKSWIYCLDKISIGRKCCIGKEVYLLTGSHDIESKNFNLTTKPIQINDGVWISTGSYILPGVKIGEYSVIAAGSIVVKDVETWTVIGGNPAKFIKKREIKS